MSTRFIRTSVVLVLFVAVPSILAQKKSVPVDPQSKPRKVRLEPAKAFQQWIDDVDAIITPQEREAWKKLGNDEEREQFISAFWHLRDPDPDTEENEYREAFYERVQYVNEHFSS